MNWKLYFDTINSERDFSLLHSTGMAWEIFPGGYSSYKEFAKMKAQYEKGEFIEPA